MRFIRLLAILGIAAAGHGCSLMYLGTSDIVGEAKMALTHHQLARRARQQAQAAWQEVNGSGVAFSKDYERGFQDGFVRAVWWGSEEAPVIPPGGYWSARYQNPDGHQAMADWAQGFRHGVRVALQTGAALSVKLPGPEPHAGPAVAHVGEGRAAPANGAPDMTPGREPETLPRPRPLPPAPEPAAPVGNHASTSKSSGQFATWRTGVPPVPAPAAPVGNHAGTSKSSGQIDAAPPALVPVGVWDAPAGTWAPASTPAALPANGEHEIVPMKFEASTAPPVQLGRPR